MDPLTLDSAFCMEDGGISLEWIAKPIDLACSLDQDVFVDLPDPSDDELHVADDYVPGSKWHHFS